MTYRQLTEEELQQMEELEDVDDAYLFSILGAEPSVVSPAQLVTEAQITQLPIVDEWVGIGKERLADIVDLIRGKVCPAWTQARQSGAWKDTQEKIEFGAWIIEAVIWVLEAQQVPGAQSLPPAVIGLMIGKVLQWSLDALCATWSAPPTSEAALSR